MRKTTFLKTFLVALGMLVGTSAWATVGDKTTNLDINFSNAISEGVVTGTVGSITIGGSNTVIADGILRVGNGTSTATLTGSAAGSGDQVVVTFELAFGKLLNKKVWFRLKDSSSNVIGEFDFYPYGGTINTNSFGISTGDLYYANNTVIWDRKVSFTITLNYKTRKITTATTCYKSGTSKAATNAEHTVDMTNSNPMASFEIGSDYNNDDRRCSFDNLKVETIEGEATTVTSYTIYYKKGEDVVKTVSISDGVVGQVVTALTAIDGDDSKHYLTTAAEAPSMTLVAEAASNVLNVSVRSPYTATYRLTKNINGNSGYVDYPFTETDAKVCSYAVGWPMYEKDGDDYYALTGESNYAAMGSFTDGQLIEKTVNYTTAATDIVWFNDLNGVSVTDAGYSGGSYTSTDQQLANVTVDAGVYDVIFNVVSKAGSGTNHRNEGVSVNGTNVANLEGNVNGIRTLRIIVENDNSTITAYGNGNANNTDNLDYVIICKIMDGTTIHATISSAGWASLFTPYALDFSGVTGLTAYTATVSGTTVTLTPVENVPANTGIVLKGAAGNYSIPVIASSSTAKGDLKGSTTDDKAYDTSYDYYYLALNGSNAKFKKLTSGSIAAGKAYLQLTPSAARELSIVFDDETTGIHSIDNGKLTIDNSVYDLSGRRVAKPTKGLYIVNGKKVAVK